MGTKVDVDVGQPLILWTKEDSEAVAEALEEHLVDRVRNKGVGADGRRLRPYRRLYKGKRSLTDVNLTKSGKTLDTLRVRATATRASVEPVTRAGFIHDRSRPWLGMTPQEADTHIMDPVVLPIIDAHMAEADTKGRRP